MESASARLDFESNSAVFFGEEVDMIKVSTGHYCVELISDGHAYQ